MAKVLIVLAPERFQDDEYLVPRNILENNGIEITIASTKEVAISSTGKEEKVDILLKDATTDYDAILLVGGIGATIYIEDLIMHKLLNDFKNENKIISAICISPATLARSGVLEGKKATIYPGKKELITDLGIEYVDDSVVVDGNVITANGPVAAKEFGETIVKKLE
jgi:protease I